MLNVSGYAKTTTMKQGNIILIIYFLLTFASCSTEITIENYIDLNANLMLTVNTTNDQKGLTECKTQILVPNSEKYLQFIGWTKNNQGNWKSTPASYNVKVSLTQKNFRFLYNQDFVVIGFADNDGKAKQYSKTVKKGELDFLINGLTTYEAKKPSH